MVWHGQLYVDTVLPFGLHSAPQSFTALADALQWFLEKQGVSWLEYYLDDFITVGAPGTNECATNQAIICSMCKFFGALLVADKYVSTTTCLPPLGIEVDSVAMELRFLAEKLTKV